MVFMCVIKKKLVCVLVIFEREKLYCKSQIQSLCAPAEFCWHLMGKCGTAPKQNLTES